MSKLDWSKFHDLPGDQSQNFEKLCWNLVRLHFEQYGEFRTLRNQPGVEFDLNLTKGGSSLGSSSEWWGWQCKYHERKKNNGLKSPSKTDIEKSLRITEQRFPEITNWVLWTPYTLINSDQKWFRALKTDMKLHLWTEKTVETYLMGPGEHFRGAYFGELVATPDELLLRHQDAVQPIKDRWFEPVHQETEAERELRRRLGEHGSWKHLAETGEAIQEASSAITEFLNSNRKFPKGVVDDLLDSCNFFSMFLMQFYELLANGDFDLIQQKLKERETVLIEGAVTTPRRLRNRRVPIALDATNAVYYMRSAQSLLDEIEDFLSVGIVAVLADAGGGKTQLAAAITSHNSRRPAGILLHGRNLHRGQNLDDLAKGYSLNGKPVESFEQLLVALDAAAKRSHCRLPIVIDGLNEAENPKDWKFPLTSLAEIVKRYPNILVACTLRTGEHSRYRQRWDNQNSVHSRESFAVMALPDTMRKIESEGFDFDAGFAIKKYFKYFNIEVGDVDVSIGILRRPLMLRMFCQATNPGRQSKVVVNNLPSSIVSLFEKIYENAVRNIVDLPNIAHSHSVDDVEKVLYILGKNLWEQKSREVAEGQFRREVKDAGIPWERSIVNILSEEGLILRNPGETSVDMSITPIFDAFGGFLIAKYLLLANRNDRSFSWLNEKEAMDAFAQEGGHPLASDIFSSLVALTPRMMNGIQLWKASPRNLRNAALRFSRTIEARDFDEETVQEIKMLFLENPGDRFRVYSWLSNTRSAVDHPLNAEFLDTVLRPMSVGERDLSWTEWIRKYRVERLADILNIENKWKSSLASRSEPDRLRMKWLMWHLTSTDRELRDVTTRALYWFGRGNPPSLLEETIDSLGINDPYVPERMFAASYGVLMACRGDSERTSIMTNELPGFARRIYDEVFSGKAPHQTTHLLLREYASKIMELAYLHNPTVFSDEEFSRSTPPFQMNTLSEWGVREDPRYTKHTRPGFLNWLVSHWRSWRCAKYDSRREYEPSPFRMDFENYTIGRLVPDRRNYDYGNKNYKSVKERILWRIEELGWFAGDFDAVDKEIEENQYRFRSRTEAKKVDRYGKKYSWIAYFEMSGLLHDQGKLDRTDGYERIPDVDIDPSFPERVMEAELFSGDLLGDAELKMDDWLLNGELPDMMPYMKVPSIGEHDGPWVALDGHISQEDNERGRNSFCFIRSFIVKNDILDSFLSRLREQDLSGRWLPEISAFFYTFSDEIPWCKTYAGNNHVKFSFVENERTVRVEKIKTELYLDGEKLDISPLDLIDMRIVGINISDDSRTELSEAEIERVEYRDIPIEVDEIQKEYVEYDVLIPVCCFSWESYHSVVNDAGSAVALAKEISDDLNLFNRAQEFDLFTKSGVRASLNVSNRGQGFRNKQSFFFIREELLRSYLQKHDSSLVWATWGERGYSSGWVDKLLSRPTLPSLTHGDIKEINSYKV